MSDWSARAVVGSLLVRGLTDEELGWEMLALMEAVDFEYERWCRVLGLDPDSEQGELLFRDAHRRWAEAWLEVGDSVFDAQISPRVRQWRTILGQRAKAAL